MVTGASTANLALILIDARKGMVEQTHRHSFIASLLKIPHVIVCINKMDLVDYDEKVYDKIVEDYKAFSSKLEVFDIQFVPISALNGDNVVNRSRAWHGTREQHCFTCWRVCTLKATTITSTAGFPYSTWSAHNPKNIMTFADTPAG
jgi:sulfate adenylyltransferase subunit 1 (EFTu-like GTPase family)